MTQPTFTEGPPVPLMVEGLLDPPALARLFDDLETVATVIGVREKGGPGEYAGGDELSMPIARERLLTGAARAVQVRYRHDGHEWTDTVLVTAAGYRVVRCRHSL